MKELRNRADDAARNILMHEQEGIAYAAPLAGQHFEHLLGAIAALYSNDDLGLGLASDFWCPMDGGMNSASNSMVERFPLRQVSLFKFVRMAGDLGSVQQSRSAFSICVSVLQFSATVQLVFFSIGIFIFNWGVLNEFQMGNE